MTSMLSGAAVSFRNTGTSLRSSVGAANAVLRCTTATSTPPALASSVRPNVLGFIMCQLRLAAASEAACVSALQHRIGLAATAGRPAGNGVEVAPFRRVVATNEAVAHESGLFDREA